MTDIREMLHRLLDEMSHSEVAGWMITDYEVKRRRGEQKAWDDVVSTLTEQIERRVARGRGGDIAQAVLQGPTPGPVTPSTTDGLQLPPFEPAANVFVGFGQPRAYEASLAAGLGA
jgi:hypothetical protein